MKRKHNLEESIKQLKEDPKNNKNFIYQLINSNLYTPVRNITESIDGTSLIFNTLVDNKNHQYLIFFTNVDEILLNEGLSKQDIIEVSYSDIISIIFDETSFYHGFVINPFTDSIIVDREDIYQINNKTKKAASIPSSAPPNNISDSKSTIFGIPMIYPVNEFEFICHYFRSNKYVDKVYFTLMQQGGQDTYIFGIEHSLDFKSLEKEIYDTIKFYLPKSYDINVLEYQHLPQLSSESLMLLYEK
ncbi:MAG: SseB family protein [Clostridiales bacterium]|jgi:hypothetical protein|nr:SseB family protein [Clostridiales bacterium]